MRPMNITGVTNYNLSVVQALLDGFVAAVCFIKGIALSEQFKQY